MSAFILSFFPAALAWAALAYELQLGFHHSRDPAKRSFRLGLLLLALALTVLVPPVSLAVDRFSSIGNVSRILGHALVLTAACAIQVYLIQLNYPDERGRWRVQRRGSALIGTVALLITFFALAPVHREAPDFWGRYQSAPYILEYRLIFVAYLGWALSTIARLCRRYAGITKHPATALGLRLVVIGGALGLGYCLHETLRVVTAAAGTTNPLVDSDLITRALIATSVGLMVIGGTMPAWGPIVGIPAFVGWFRRYRAYRRLHRLWRDLYEVSPDIALLHPVPPLIDALTLLDLDFRLYRRVVEIRDGLLALRRYRHPAPVSVAGERCRVAGLDEEETRLVMEAASVAAAIEAKRQSSSTLTGSPAVEMTGGADVASEVLALERLARFYSRSRIVRDIRDGVRRTGLDDLGHDVRGAGRA